MNHIIQINENHILECAQLYVRVFNDKPWNDDWTMELANRRLLDIFNSPNFEGILCMYEDKVIGAVFGNYEQYYNGTHYYLREMFVSNEYQGTGIGTRLLLSLEEILKKNNVTSTYLFTSKGNKTSEFYQKNEFSIWDEMAMMGKHY